MPRKWLLSYDRTNKCWRKQIDGQRVYFGMARGRWNVEDYKLALKRYQEYLIKHGHVPLAATSTKDLPEATPTRRHKRPPPTSIEGVLIFFTEYKRAEAIAGNVSPSHFGIIEYAVDTIRTFVGPKRHRPNSLNSKYGFNGERLAGFRKWLIRRTDNPKGKLTKISPSTANNLFHVFKSVCRFAYANEWLEELPRNIDFHKRIPVPRPKVQTYTIEDLETLFSSFDPSNRHSSLLACYILLALNCGYTGNDVATLTTRMIDLEDGYITRRRSKTNVPQIHKLWPLTHQFLEATYPKKPLITDSGETLWFKTKRGRPLVWSKIKENGKHQRVDSIYEAFHRHRQVAFPDPPHGLSFRFFRKTSASFIRKQDRPNTAILEQLFLAHSPSTIADRFYVSPDQETLNESTDKLYKTFQLEMIPNLQRLLANLR